MIQELFMAADVKPCKRGAVSLASAILELVKADSELNEKIKNTPSYLPTMTRADWAAEQQESWNRAADEVLYNVRQVTGYFDSGHD
jgi:hypothetical protein